MHRLVVFGAFACCLVQRFVGALGWRDGVGAFGGGGGFVVVGEQDWGQGLFHVPADVVGEHVQEHVGADPVGQPMPDGAYVQFAVEGAEEAFDVGEVFVAAHHVVAAQGVVGQAGA